MILYLYESIYSIFIPSREVVVNCILNRLLRIDMRRKVGELFLAGLLALQNPSEAEAGPGNQSESPREAQSSVRKERNESSIRDFMDGKLDSITVPSEDDMRYIIERSSREYDLKEKRFKYVVETIANEGGYRIINVSEPGTKFTYDPRNEYRYTVSEPMLKGGIVGGDKLKNIIMPEGSDKEEKKKNLNWFYDTYSPIPVNPSILSNIEKFNELFESITVESPGASYVITFDNLKNTYSDEFKKAVSDWNKLLMEYIIKASEHFTNEMSEKLKSSEKHEQQYRLTVGALQMSVILIEDSDILIELFNKTFKEYRIRLSVNQ